MLRSVICLLGLAATADAFLVPSLIPTHGSYRATTRLQVLGDPRPASISALVSTRLMRQCISCVSRRKLYMPYMQVGGAAVLSWVATRGRVELNRIESNVWCTITMEPRPCLNVYHPFVVTGGVICEYGAIGQGARGSLWRLWTHRYPSLHSRLLLCYCIT